MSDNSGVVPWNERETCDPLPVPPAEIHEEYRTFVSDIEDRVTQLSSSLPLSEPFPVHESLFDLSRQWDQGEKSLRSVPVVNLYQRVLGRPVPDDVVRALLGIDAHINALDDIIDTQTPTKEWKTGVAAVVSFSSAYAFEHVPAEVREQILDQYYDYLVELFQIPRLEREFMAQFRQASTDVARLDAATAFYSQRGTAMKIFANIPALVLDRDFSTNIAEDLSHLKSRQLLFKDLSDVERDLQDDDVTPVLHMLQTCTTKDDVISFLENVYEQFPYSTEGRDQYGDILFSLEDAPSETVTSVRNGMETATGSQVSD
jgi:hypothetical protein